MALYLFPSPQIARSQTPIESEPVFSLWTRVKRDVVSTVLRKADGATWEEWAWAWPHLQSPAATYFFGGRGFSTMGSDQSAWSAATRLYLGGHVYVIDDNLRTELLNAVTAEAPSGYGAFIVSAPPGSVFTGDEILLSGRTSDTAKPHA